MKKQGFTLLELLAVIVILAIIALITIPIVLNMIEKSKKESAKRSAENYVKKVEETFAIDNMEEQKVDGTYSVNGNTMTKDSKNYVIKMKGQLPKATSTLTLDEKGGVSLGTLLVGKYTINFADGNISNISTSTVTESTSSDISELKEQIETLKTQNTALSQEVSEFKSDVNNRFSYSKDEVKIGKWVDGKNLYRKTFVYGSAAANANILIGSISNADTIFVDESASYFIIGSLNGLYKTGAIVPITVAGRNADDLSYAAYSAIYNNEVRVLLGQYTNATKVVVTVQYTKTTD